MPNHVTHRISVSGPVEVLKQFEQAHIITIPPKPDTTWSGEPILNPDGTPVMTKQFDTFDFETVTPMPEEVRNSTRVGPRAEGLPDWYTWSVDNWGTKWNAYHFKWVDNPDPHVLEFMFDTAWGSPEPIFHKLAKKWPTLEFSVVGFDEGWNFAVIGKGSNGTFTIDDVEATDDLYEAVFHEAPYEED